MRREIAKACLEAVSASEATCPPKLNERRWKQSIFSLRGNMDCFVARAPRNDDAGRISKGGQGRGELDAHHF
jgi:hypothetical protein